MIDVLHSGLCETLVTLLLLLAAITLYIIFREGAEEDAQTRTFNGIDKYILPFLSLVAIPHIYIAYCLWNGGFILLYVFNLGAIALLWYMGNRYVIGGADAICFIFVALLLPFVIPLVIMTISTLVIEKIMRWRSPSIDAEWGSGKVPLLVPGKYGYIITLPMTLIFLILIGLGI